MLNAWRGGFASLARTQRLPSLNCADSGLRLLLRSTQPQPRKQSLSGLRALTYSSRYRQIAAARSRIVESEVQDEVNAQRPPSDEQIREAVRHGPVTRFQELLDRGMVCDTVVDTITKDMGLVTMTEVQSMTINETLKGIDV